MTNEYAAKIRGTIEKVKCILFTCEDGAVVALPLKLVAEARAKYYAERDKDTTFESEVEYVMNDDHEGIDWFRNNQNPEDFSGHYTLVTPPKELRLEDRVANSAASYRSIYLFVPKE